MSSDPLIRAVVVVVLVLLIFGSWRVTRTTSSAPAAAAPTSTTIPAFPPVAVSEESAINPALTYASDCLVGELGETQLRPVPCDEPHDLEIYREVLIERSVTEFDAEVIDEYADQVCRTSMEAMLPDHERYEFTFIRPNEQTWERHTRVVRCILFDPTGQSTGRARTTR